MRKEVNLFLFTGDISVDLENLRNQLLKTITRTNEFSKVSGYQVNRQKSIMFLYASGKQLSSEIVKMIQLAVAPRNV